MPLSVNTWTMSQPLPSKVHPHPLPLFSLTAVSFGIKAVRENCCFALRGTSHPSCLPCFRGVLTCLLPFPSSGLSTMFPGYATLPLTFQLASSHQDQMYSVHLQSNGSKGISLKILNSEAFAL